jgi:hypothetical protein
MRIKEILFAVIFMLIPLYIAAQEKPAPVEPPEPPDETFEVYSPFHQISEKEEERLLQELNQELRENLKELKKINKEEYIELLRESQYRNMRYPFATKREKSMLQREKEIFELEVTARVLSQKYSKQKSVDKGKIKTELSTTLSKLFDLKEMNRKSQVEELEKQLTELKNELQVRSKNKEEIIRRRIQELLGEDDYLDWD